MTFSPTAMRSPFVHSRSAYLRIFWGPVLSPLPIYFFPFSVFIFTIDLASTIVISLDGLYSIKRNLT